MPVLTALGASNGFTAGDLNTDGWIAVVPAYQKVYFADGRIYSATIGSSGYHKLDCINTSLVGAPSGAFTKGETVTQAVSGATGIFDETVGAGGTAKNLVYRTSITEFVVAQVVTGGTSAKTVTPTAVNVPPQWLNWILTDTITTTTTPFSYLNITSANLDSSCGDDGVNTCAAALNGTGYWAHNVNETHWFILDLGQTYEVKACKGRSLSVNDPANVNIYVSDSKNNWGTAVWSNIPLFKNTTNWITYGWPVKSGRYVKVEITQTENVNNNLTFGTVTPFCTIFDVGTVGITSTVETFSPFPDGGSNIMALCGGRIYMNSMFNPNQWFCTRQGNPLDLNTAVDDEQAASSSQVSVAGLVGDAITAFIPFKDHYLIFGGAKSMWVLRGDPRQGGTISNLTYDCGIFSPTSWCYDDKDNLYWVDLTGFYRLTKEALINGGAPENILINSVPNLFKTMQLNRRTDRVVCGYDRDRHGIVVSISMLDGAWECSWFYDILYGSLLPDKYGSTTIPASVLYANSYRGDYRALLVGGYDGYVRKFDEDTLDDDGTPMGSYVLLGPINLYQWVRGSGMIDEIEITLGEVTTNCVWSLFAKETAEDIYDAVINAETPVATGTFSSGGIQTVIKQRISGKYIGLLLKNTTANKTWETEGIKVHLKISGKDKE